MSELLPCPFCGHEAKIVCVDTDRYDDWYVYCPGEYDCPAVSETLMFETKDEAIAAWNTRAERTCEAVNVNGYAFRFECSLCGYVAIVHNCNTRLDELPRFCPNCGAKVVEE